MQFTYISHLLLAMPSPVSVKKEASESDPKVGEVKKPKREKVVDFRLAEMLENSRHIRGLLRDGGRLVRWKSEEHVNIINLEALGINSILLQIVASYHCVESKTVKAPRINLLKAQAR